MNERLAIPDVAERFTAYLANNPAWGSLHIVLEDGCVDVGYVAFCLQCAEERGDTEGAELAKILLGMTRTQRLKLPYVCQNRMERVQ